MTAKRKTAPAPALPIDVSPLAPDAMPRQREVFRVERLLALSAARLGITVSADGRVSSKDAARLIVPHRRDGDGQLRRWRDKATGPAFAKLGRAISYTLHALAQWSVEQEREPNA